MAPIRRLLIANRGEIAVRIIATARRMDIVAIAVFSDADRNALHVRSAGEAVRIGPPPASQSYLNIAAILAAAKASNADAVHPGYGFLSENAEFADAVRGAGMAFVGPSGKAIRLMGDKSAAKRIMAEAGVPVVPGYPGGDQSDARLTNEADATGYPVLIKAMAGGGGRGMRIVRRAMDFGEALSSARREAKSAFGDDRVLIEKLVENARHIEVQIFGDRHGNAVHLFERDCSAQRRHQKVIEEAPAPSVDASLRQKLGDWAVAAAKSANYEGAGTVEFIAGADGKPYFIEMNTRLQVEHPVTEMVTGLNLVEWQLRVAQGEKLPLRQDEIKLEGHAIEARLYAEDPARGFLPQTGRVAHFRPGAKGRHGWRIDASVEAGEEVTAYYDPMVAKLIAHGRDRNEAIESLCALIEANPLIGIAANGGFLVRLLRSRAFRAAEMTTATIDAWQAAGDPVLAAPVAGAQDFVHAAAVLALHPGGSWFRSGGIAEYPVDLVHGDVARSVRLIFRKGVLRRAHCEDETFEFDGVRLDGEWLLVTGAGYTRRRRVFVDGRHVYLVDGAGIVGFSEPDILAAKAVAADPRRIVAPASGTLIRVLAIPGDRIAAGAPIAVIEAMKMETTLCAAAAGLVAAIHAKQGEQIGAGDLIAEIDPDQGEALP